MDRRQLLRIAGSAAAGLTASRAARLLAAAPAASSPAASSPADAPVRSVLGSVRYDGVPPEPRVLDCRMDPFCAKKFKDSPLLSEELVVSEDARIQNVFVHVAGGLPKGRTWPIPDQPVTFEENCQFIPHVVGVRAGQPLEFANRSETVEFPHGLPRRNPEFSFSLPKKGMTARVVLTEPEAFRILCDVHPWEIAWCHVVSHPFFAITDARGEFRLAGLDPGRYELEFWHERLGVATRTVTVEAGRAVRLEPVMFKPQARDVTRSATSPS